MIPASRPALLLFAILGIGVGCTQGDDDDDMASPSPSPTNPCPRLPAASDRTRYVVVSHPYAASGMPASEWEVVALDASGVLSSATVATFTMGRATGGEVVFTPDGEVGLTAQQDGTLGVFALDSSGSPAIVDAAFSGTFYASRVVMDPSGERAWVIESNTLGNGGGIYEVGIGCDAALTDRGLVKAVDLPYDLAWSAPVEEWLLYSRALDDAPGGTDLHQVSLLPWQVHGSVDVFPNDADAIVSDLAVTVENAWGIVADANQFSGHGNRVAVIDLGPGAMSGALDVEGFDEPFSIAVSPQGGSWLWTNGDRVHWVTYDLVTAATGTGELIYVGGAPQLPASAVVIERGSQRGLVLIAENLGVRRVRFQAAGAPIDLGRTSLGSGFTTIVGAIGVQP